MAPIAPLRVAHNSARLSGSSALRNSDAPHAVHMASTFWASSSTVFHQPVQFDDQDRLCVGRVPRVKNRFAGVYRVSVHHFQGRRDDTGGDDVRHGLRRAVRCSENAASRV